MPLGQDSWGVVFWVSYEEAARPEFKQILQIKYDRLKKAVNKSGRKAPDRAVLFNDVEGEAYRITGYAPKRHLMEGKTVAFNVDTLYNEILEMEVGNL
jgi:hypothetical protein